jgi:carbonic anhydrase/acetyltransferase-like protein (isoleucine patch superfamily)
VLLEHRGRRPIIDGSAYVAPTATICGDVSIGPESRILFGAVIVAEGGPVKIGSRAIVMENAVVRGTRRHPVHIGDDVLVGPRAYLSGCIVEDDAFVASGVTIFNGARLGRGAEVRVNGVVHVNSVVMAEETVPIGWVAVGNPARILPPNAHETIAPIQRELNFTSTVFGLDRETSAAEVMSLYTRSLARHAEDVIIPE